MAYDVFLRLWFLSKNNLGFRTMGLLRRARGLNISSLTSQIKRGSWNFIAHCAFYHSVATSAIIRKLDCFQILGLTVIRCQSRPLRHMEIRAATISDAYGIAEIQIAGWKAAYRGLMPDSVLDGLSVPKREEMWQRIFAEQKLQLLVAEHDGRIVGFVDFGSCRDSDAVPGRIGEILAIYVDPHRWHAGIGQELLGGALSGLKLAGFNEATLWVLDSNSRARVFYERAGFSCDGATKSETVGDNAKIQEVRYRRPL